MIVNSTGVLWAWGTNDKGQLGIGTTASPQATPLNISTFGSLSGSTVVAVAGGGNHTVALDGTGVAHTWGQNDTGQLGRGNVATPQTTPINAGTFGSLSGRTLSAVAGGQSHTVALDNTGTVHSWGRNSEGQLGRGNTTTPQSTPINVGTFGSLSGRTIVEVACGSYYTVALDSTGTVHAWGLNNFGQLGRGNLTTPQTTPINVSTYGSLSGKIIIAVACGNAHTVALDNTGALHAWGFNGTGQLGRGNTTDSSTPINVSTFGSLSGRTVVAVACAYQHTVALDNTGTAHAWGDNFYGQVGRGDTTTPQTTPINVGTYGSLSGRTLNAVACGKYHTLALDTTGMAHTWGQNDTGQLGIGTTATPQTTPIVVPQSFLGSENRIGVGTTIPRSELDVAGTVRAGNFVGDFAGDINGVSYAAVLLTTARTIAGVSYSGSNSVTFPSLTQTGNKVLGDPYNFSASTTWSISNVFTSNVASSIVARDANGDLGANIVYAYGNIGIGTTLPKQNVHLTANNHLNLASNVQLTLNNTAATVGQFLQTSGTAVSWATFTGGTSSSNVVLTSGTNQNFTIGSNVKYVVVSMWGAGGGGGSGITNATCSGGAGGSSGQYLRFMVPNITNGNSNMVIKYTIGTGGTAGVAGTGGTGGNTIVEISSNVGAPSNVFCTAYGGNGGAAGQAGATSTGGTAVAAITQTFLYKDFGNSLAGASGTSGAAGTNGTYATVSWGPGSGASGGGKSSTTAYNGGTGGDAIIFGGTVTGGSAGTGTSSGAGGNAGNGPSYTSGSLIVSAGGGGGGGNGTTGGGNGGNGGTPGGGGGGGGSTSSGTAGSGGSGGNGLVILECY